MEKGSIFIKQHKISFFVPSPPHNAFSATYSTGFNQPLPTLENFWRQNPSAIPRVSIETPWTQPCWLDYTVNNLNLKTKCFRYLIFRWQGTLETWSASHMKTKCSERSFIGKCTASELTFSTVSCSATGNVLYSDVKGPRVRILNVFCR